MRGAVRVFSLTLLLFYCSGCSWIFSDNKDLPPPEPAVLEPTPSEAQPPYSLEIEEALNDGDRLKVVAHITPQVERSIDDAVVRLTGTHEGKVVQTETLPLSKALLDQDTPATLETDSIYRLAASIPVQGVSDYQLELIWGNEALAFRQAKASAPLVKVEQIKLEKGVVTCVNKKCAAPYTMLARVSNLSSTPVNHVILGVGLTFQPQKPELASAPKNAENEQKVELQGLKLAPGQSKKLKLVFEKLIPELKEGRIEPSIRVLEVS